MVTLNIIAILLSVSIRNPMLATAPFDYEYRMGIRGANYNITCLFERENGRYGYGDEISYIRKFKTLHTSNIKFTSYVRETKDLNTKTIDVYSKHDNFEIGLSLALTDLEKLDVLPYLGYKSKWLTADLRIAPQRIISNVLAEYRYKISKHIQLHPFLKYCQNNSKIDYQGKVELEYLI